MTDVIALPFFLAGMIYTVVCLLLLAVSFTALWSRELLGFVQVLAFVVIGFGAVCAALELQALVEMSFSEDRFARAAFVNRAIGPYALYYWIGLVTTVVVPQLFWIRRFRTTAWIAVVIGLVLLWQPIFELLVRVFT